MSIDLITLIKTITIPIVILSKMIELDKWDMEIARKCIMDIKEVLSCMEE